MPNVNDLYIANLAFLLDYDEGYTNDEIEYEIFKVAFQDKETVHYDRQMGGNFRDLEQEKNNIATMMMFTTNLIQSIYYTNAEKNNDPYIVVGYSNIKVNNDMASLNEGEYLVTIEYKLLSDLNNQGKVSI